MQHIEYKVGFVPSGLAIAAVYDNSGLNRPTDDIARINKMYSNSNLIVSAWNGDQLVGIARSITDFCYACYLSDLAVRKENQKDGIGKRLIKITRQEIGEQTNLILISAPNALEYYPKVGFDVFEGGFIIKRKK